MTFDEFLHLPLIARLIHIRVMEELVDDVNQEIESHSPTD